MHINFSCLPVYQKGPALPEFNDLERVWTLPKSVSSQIFQDLEGVLTFQLLRIKMALNEETQERLTNIHQRLRHMWGYL